MSLPAPATELIASPMLPSRFVSNWSGFGGDGPLQIVVVFQQFLAGMGTAGNEFQQGVADQRAGDAAAFVVVDAAVGIDG